MSTINIEDLHIVVAALESQGNFLGYAVVSAPLTYEQALDVWQSKEQYKIGVRKGLGHVRQFAVRSIADPRFQPLITRGYADAIGRDGKRSFKGDVGIVKAAKAWAKANGYKGNKGGWIKDSAGNSVVQGWFAFATWLRQRQLLAEGSDGRWYVLSTEVVA